MHKQRKKITSIIPKYSLLPLIITVSFNMAVYIGSRKIAGNWYHYNIETGLDTRIPFWPPSVIIYLGCYLFWIANYILIARQEKKEVCQFFVSEILSKTVCLVFFVIFPTTNVRPAVNPGVFWNQVMIFLYAVDAADNLFPSIHCLVSWFCYIGLRKNKKIPVWYKTASCVIAVLVCISTLTTKQHVIWDVIGGVFLAEVCFWIGQKQAVYSIYEKFLDKANRKILKGWEYIVCSQKRKQ